MKPQAMSQEIERIAEQGLAQPYLWRRAKQVEFEARTSVKWSYDTAYGKLQFTPAFRARETGYNDYGPDQEAVIAVLSEEKWPGHVPFLRLAETLSWTLVNLFATLNSLRCRQKVTFAINRMGEATAVRAK